MWELTQVEILQIKSKNVGTNTVEVLQPNSENVGTNTSRDFTA